VLVRPSLPATLRKFAYDCAQTPWSADRGGKKHVEGSGVGALGGAEMETQLFESSVVIQRSSMRAALFVLQDDKTLITCTSWAVLKVFRGVAAYITCNMSLNHDMNHRGELVKERS